jgi:Flp pilus assembly protein TadG
VTPIILMFFSFVIAVGTLQNAHGTMDAAVQAAARAASITLPSGAPQRTGQGAADQVFSNAGLGQCRGSVRVGRPSGTGQPAPAAYNFVTATGRCSVRINFGLFTLTKTVTSSFTSVIDTYRGG